jgi:large subunit ribosomal protein L23
MTHSAAYQERLMQVLIAARETEKANHVADKHGQITFKVLPGATKQEIKEAVEMLFKVQVESVRVLNVKGKKKNFGRRQGKRPDWKKAYVALKPGHDIDFSAF